MTCASPPEDIEAIAQAIRRAGVATHRTRVVLGMSGLWIMALMIPVLFLALTPVVGWYRGPLSSLFVAMGLASLVGCGAALPVPAGYRWLCRARLRRAIVGVAPEELRATLLALQQEALPDTRMIVEPLLHDLHPRSCELAPAQPPAGRGGEVTAGAAEEGPLAPRS